MRLFTTRIALLGVLLATLASGCATPGPGPVSQSDRASDQPKVLTISLEGEINALATELDSSGVSGLSSYLHDFIHDYLTVRGDRDELLPQLVTELPSIERGTWKVTDDGRMEVTWRLHRGVRWHDGTEFTSADVRFGYDVTVDPTAPLGVATEATRVIEAIETPDPYTFVAHWRTTSRWGAELGRNQM